MADQTTQLSALALSPSRKGKTTQLYAKGVLAGASDSVALYTLKNVDNHNDTSATVASRPRLPVSKRPVYGLLENIR